MIWFKRIVLGILLLGTAIVLSAPSRQGEQIPPGRTVIRYWSYWTGREADQMQQIIDVFNTTVGKEKNIWVSYISISQADQKTLLATSAGVPPDVAGVWGDQLAQFAAMGTVEPLEAMAAEHGITEAYYKPAYWKACSFEGHLYALMATPYSVALYYNKQLFAERAAKLRAAGLDPTRPPKTLQELDRYSAALDVWSAPREQGGQLLAAGFFEQQPGWWREHLYHWFGGSIYDETNKKLTLNDPKVVAAYDWLQSYTKRIGRDQVLRFVSGLPTTDTFDTPLNPFMTGAVAMIKQGPWFSSYMETLKPEMNRVKWSKEEERKLPRVQRRDNYVWGVAPFPSAVPGLENVSYAGSDLLVIPSTSHHKKEAFEFIAFVNRQDQMEHLCSMHGKNSPLAKMSQEYLDNHPNPYIEVFEELGASPNNYPVPPIPLWPELRSELQTISGTLVLDENLSAKDLLDKAQAKYQAKVDDYVRRREKRRELGLLKQLQMTRQEIRQLGKGLAFISPWLIGFLGLMLLPIVMSIYYSLCEYSLSDRERYPPMFIGLDNYRELFHDGIFWQSLGNSLYYAAMTIPSSLALSIGLAMLLNVKAPGQSIFRTIIFMPSIVPIVAAAMIWMWMFNSKIGMINYELAELRDGINWGLRGFDHALGHLGLEWKYRAAWNGPAWLDDPNWSLPALALMSLWSVGNSVVIYLAGLQDVPIELYEAAEIDGAGLWQRMWNVTLPMISPVIFFNLVMSIIGVLQVFDIPYIMTPNGGPGNRSTLLLAVYLQDVSFRFFKMGYASAIAWIMLLVIVILTGIAFWTSKRWVHYQGK